MINTVTGYAQAFLAVARAEGNLDVVKSQLAEVAQAVENNDELRSTLSNNLLPSATRNQIVDDVLAGKVSDTTRALVGLVVSSGHGADLSAIVDAFVASAASSQGRQVAVARSAVALTEKQKTLLAKALQQKVGSEIELQNVVDTDVIGGVVTTIGDTVIDGSLQTRLHQMRETL